MAAEESLTWYLYLSSLVLFKWVYPFSYIIVLGSETLIQYDCMIQMFCPSMKAGKFACLTAANSFNCVGEKHSFVMFVMWNFAGAF